MMENADFPGPADVAYFTRAQAGGWGETLRGFVKFLAPPPGAYVLDVGTGPGLLPRLLVRAGVRLAVGCDDAPAMLRRAAELTGDRLGSSSESRSGTGSETQTGVAWTLVDAVHLPFARASFDVALATNLLFLLDDPSASLAQLVRVTRPGGTVGFINPSDRLGIVAAEAFTDRRGLAGFDRFSFINYGRLAEAYRRLSLSQWAELAVSQGLADVRSETRAEGLVVFVRGERRIGER
jgi:ubiquinone/menaquinone biosynthesis C-methylase UbiE